MKRAWLAIPVCAVLVCGARAQANTRPADNSARAQWRQFYQGQRAERLAFWNNLKEEMAKYRQSSSTLSSQQKQAFYQSRKDKIQAFRDHLAAEKTSFLTQHPDLRNYKRDPSASKSGKSARNGTSGGLKG